jgi:eukaryotic-like serine/threonine-protein kinase
VTDQLDGAMQPGRMVGPYSLERRIGVGGLGDVWLARDPRGPVALKVIRPEHADRPGFRTRLGEEAATARMAAGPGVVRLLDVSTNGPIAYLVMEYLDHPDLAAALTFRGPLRGAMLETFSSTLLEAMARIHRAGVVHRDLKPTNVLVEPDGSVHVLDFGIATHTSGIVGAVPESAGTVGWRAPEVQRGEAVTVAADVFGWGLLVAYAAAGRHPYGMDGVTDPAELQRRIGAGPPDLSAVPESQRDRVRDALSTDVVRRRHAYIPTAFPANPTEAPETALPGVALVPPGASAAAEPSRRRLVAGAAVAAVGVVALLSVGVAVSQRGGKTSSSATARAARTTSSTSAGVSSTTLDAAAPTSTAASTPSSVDPTDASEAAVPPSSIVASPNTVPTPVSPVTAPSTNPAPPASTTRLGVIAGVYLVGGRDINELPAGVLTHLIYGFVPLTASGVRPIGADAYRRDVARLAALRARDANVHTVLGLGGDAATLVAASAPGAVAATATAAVKTMRADGFDGLDVLWRLPTIGTDEPLRFVALVRALRAALDKQAAADGRAYTLGVRAGWLVDDPFNISAKDQTPAEVAEFVDFWEIDSDPMRGPWNCTGNVDGGGTGHQSPLRPRPGDAFVNNGVEPAAEAWRRLGVPARKIVLMVPLHGRAFADVPPGPNGDGLGQSCRNTGTAIENVELTTDQLRRLAGGPGANDHYDAASDAAYRYDSATRLFLTYESADSIAAKRAYVTEQGFAGLGAWDVSQDTSTYTLLSLVCTCTPR